MMTSNVAFDIDKKGESHTSFPAVNWERFSCAGEGCIENEACARWNGIRKEKYSTPSRRERQLTL